MPTPASDILDMTLPCDGCRFCPTTYTSGHEVSTTWVRNENHERVIYLFRFTFWTVCSDRDEPYDGPRVSRYNRLPVI
jgi:hypothetical protein